MAKLLALVLPLCLDNFAVSFAVLGKMRLSRMQQLRIIALFIVFEAGMPLLGMVLGSPLAHLYGDSQRVVFDPYQLGSAAETYQLNMIHQTYLADSIDLTFVGRYIFPVVVPVVVGTIGILMLDEYFNDDDDDDDEGEKARAMVSTRGFVSIVWLGVGISLDELVVGFTLGFTGLPVADVVITIVVQAFVVMLIGHVLGRKVREGTLRISAERLTNGSKVLAGGLFVAIAVVLLVYQPIDTHLLPHFIHHKVAHLQAPKAVTTELP